jgi:hypothetical protein
MPHSDTICRILFRPETACFRRRRQPHGNQLIPDSPISRSPNTARRGFGGLPRGQPSSVHVTSRYAYHEAGWLVPARYLNDRLVAMQMTSGVIVAGLNVNDQVIGHRNDLDFTPGAACRDQACAHGRGTQCGHGILLPIRIGTGRQRQHNLVPLMPGAARRIAVAEFAFRSTCSCVVSSRRPLPAPPSLVSRVRCGCFGRNSHARRAGLAGRAALHKPRSSRCQRSTHPRVPRRLSPSRYLAGY